MTHTHRIDNRFLIRIMLATAAGQPDEPNEVGADIGLPAPHVDSSRQAKSRWVRLA